ncbi:MAG: dynamin family protein [Cyanobacteria bacterium P01_F01_bin.53]
MSDVGSKAAKTVEKFELFFNAYDQVSQYTNLDETAKKHIERQRDWIKRLDQEEFPVAFFGSFSAGKSTIINAILEKEILPESPQPTTAFPTILRKSETDSVVVYYIDEEAKVSLWNQQSSEIGKRIEKNLSKSKKEDYQDHLERIKREVLKYNNVSKKKIGESWVKSLETLLKGWNDKTYAATKSSIDLSDLKEYVEGHPHALFIDHIEVCISGIDIPAEVVLVDLPGLAVVNQRHVAFTKEYIQNKANAFVVCMKPNHLLEGDEIKFLESINNSNPTILQRSFWVINQWDRLNAQQRREEEENFKKKIAAYNFSMSPERFFKLSALNYLLLVCIENETIYETNKLKDHIDNLETLTNVRDNVPSAAQAKTLKEDKRVISFSDFKESLFSYLRTTAKDEFIKDAKSELSELSETLERGLNSLHEEYNQDDDLEVEFRSVAIRKQTGKFIGDLEERIENFAVQERTLKGRVFWGDSDTEETKREIDRRISQMDKKKISNALLKGLDIQEGNFILLPSIIFEEITLTSFLRNQITTTADAKFVQNLKKLLLELKAVNKDYLPGSVSDMLSDRLSERDIFMRLNGLADSLFYEYDKGLQEVSLEDCEGDSLEDRTDIALDRYKNAFMAIADNLTSRLNKYIRGSVMNHVEYIEKELLHVLRQQEELITAQISRKVEVSDAIAQEKQKRTAIKNTYTALVNLKNGL